MSGVDPVAVGDSAACVDPVACVDHVACVDPVVCGDPAAVGDSVIGSAVGALLELAAPPQATTRKAVTIVTRPKAQNRFLVIGIPLRVIRIC